MGRELDRKMGRFNKENRPKTYNLTLDQMREMWQKESMERLAKAKKEATDEAVNTAMILLLTLPMKVLMDHYWTKSYEKRLPGFINHVLEYYEKWQNGELDMDQMREELWEVGGVKLEERDG